MLCAPTLSAGDGALLEIVRFGAVTVLVFDAQLVEGEQEAPGVGGLVPPSGSIDA